MILNFVVHMEIQSKNTFVLALFSIPSQKNSHKILFFMAVLIQLSLSWNEFNIARVTPPLALTWSFWSVMEIKDGRSEENGMSEFNFNEEWNQTIPISYWETWEMREMMWNLSRRERAADKGEHELCISWHVGRCHWWGGRVVII